MSDQPTIGNLRSFTSRERYFDRQGEPIDMWQWAKLLDHPNYRVVAQTDMVRDDQTIQVSTVWLGLNHNWSPIGPPRIFETMIFGGPRDLEQWRYATVEAAQEGHIDTIHSLRLQGYEVPFDPFALEADCDADD